MTIRINNDLSDLKHQLQEYHGGTKLKNIPEITSSVLFQSIAPTIMISLDQTVCDVIKKLNDVLSTESVILQFGKFQEQMRKKSILPSQRLPENQRIEFYQHKNVHEWLELLLSPKEHYFTINPASFKKGDKKYNRGVFQNAIDAVVIDPEHISDSSLETLDITLDPDCQNIKDIFKKMRPLNYQDADEKRYTVRIHEYEGKYIVFAAHKILYNASQPATKGEQKKEDVTGHMAVYPDIFSMVRREEYIIGTTTEKQQEYADIKKKLVASIREIDRNKKEYSVRVQQNVQEIIAEINNETSAKIVADKLYHLYKITGKHSGNDKLLLEASMKNFTKRIAQLIGISSYTQLHLLELTDTLDDQNSNLEYFYTQISMFLADPTIRYSKFLLAFENYYTAQRGSLKEPFRTFDKQIKQCFGDIATLRTKNPTLVMQKAQVILALQKKIWETYTWKHEFKLGNLSPEGLQQKLLDVSSDESIKHAFPGLYASLFARINEKRAQFSVDFTKSQLNRFFDELNDMELLQSTIDVLDGMFK